MNISWKQNTSNSTSPTPWNFNKKITTTSSSSGNLGDSFFLNLHENKSDQNTPFKRDQEGENERRFYGDGSFNDFCYSFEPILQKNLMSIYGKVYGITSQDVHEILVDMYSKVPGLMMRLAAAEPPSSDEIDEK